ncbi:hypothetical protein, partial [Gaiella sp.]|uniref:pilus assembly PilX family protein n=1 Tax=Gaiella sp. TaxID=2663207 RepID=UPI00398387F0
MRRLTSRLLRAVHARLADETGVALVIALGMMMVLAISTAAIATLVTSNQKAFSRDQDENRALNLTEAGVNYGLSRLTQTITNDPGTAIGWTFPSNAASGGRISFTTDGGAGTWWAEKTAAQTYTIHAQALSPNGAVLRNVSVRTQADTTYTTTLPSLAWANGLFVASPSGCATIAGSATVTMSLWIASDLCLSGSNSVEEPSATGDKKVKVYVGGKLTTNGSAKIGTSTRKIISATIVGGCNGGTNASCSNAAVSKVNADAYGSSTSTVTKPQVYPDATYASANWSTPSCSTGSFTFDNDTTRNSSVGDTNIFGGSNYTCTVYSAAGVTVGSLAWNATSRVLTVSGTVFIDGNLKTTGGTAIYSGSGTIFFNGSVQTNGNGTLCAPGQTIASSGKACDGTWNSDASAGGGALAIVTLSGGWAMTGTAEWSVLAYVVGN